MTKSVSDSCAARNLLRRDRLIDLIGHPPRTPITLITAPAGYGKTTLAEQWRSQAAHQVAWHALGPESNSLDRFLATLVTAVERAGIDPLATGATGLTLDEVMRWIGEHAAGRDAFTIIVDDYHTIENPDVHEAVDALLAHLPPNLYLILLSRTVPPLSLARRRVLGEVTDIAVQDLTFSVEEVRAVVRDMPLPLDVADRLTERTEGWIAGIRLGLAALDSRQSRSAEEVVAHLAHHPWLNDYLVEEVLDRLPADLRSFVLRSAHLPWLDADLCNHALELETSARFLDRVRRRIVFVRPGPEPGTMVFHALFAECVQRIAARVLMENERWAFYRRTSDWLARHQHLELALTHAVMAQAWDEAQDYARTLCRDALHYALHYSRLHWLRQLPEPLVLADPFLARSYVTALQLGGQVREARRAFDLVEPVWRVSNDPVQLGYAASCRTDFAIADGEPEFALRHCHVALHYYPLDQVIERMFAWGGVVGSEFLRGNDQVADLAYRQVARCRERIPVGQGLWTLMFEPDRAWRQALRGNLHSAESVLRSVVATLPAQYRRFYEPRLRTRLAAIYLEWNELDRAVTEAARIERGLEAISHQTQHPECLLMVSRVAAAVGDEHKADATLRQARVLGEEHGIRSIMTRLDSMQAVAWLEADNLDLAREWAATMRLEDCALPMNIGEPDPRLALVRIDLASGYHERAHAWLRDPIAGAVANRRWAELVPLAVWQMVACLERGDEPAALEALKMALRHGRRGRFVRSFLTPGHDPGPFLRRALPQLERDDAAWLEHLLDRELWPPAAGDEPVAAPPLLVHPLSRRELEVLELIERGLPNRDIGSALFISERTVKRHVGSILAKLGAGNRVEAVERAREYGIVVSDPTG